MLVVKHTFRRGVLVLKFELFVEHNNNQVSHKVITEKIKEIWKNEGNKVKDINTVDIYYKPEEQSCYYVINDEVKGNFSV